MFGTLAPIDLTAGAPRVGPAEAGRVGADTSGHRDNVRSILTSMSDAEHAEAERILGTA